MAGFYHKIRMLDSNKQEFPWPIIENKPMVLSEPWYYEIANGKVPCCVGWQKMGFNADIQATEEIVAPQGGTYAFPGSAMQMSLVSDSVEDDPDKGGAVAGTGAWTVTLRYLDGNYDEQSEVVELNGAAAVDTTATNILRVQNCRVSTAGTGGKAAGNISIKGKVDGKTYGYIAAGNTRQLQFVWTVPDGKVLNITHASVYVVHTAANKYCTVTLRSNYDDASKTVGTVFHAYAEALLDGGGVSPNYTLPKYFIERSDLMVVGKSTGTASVALTMGGVVKDE